MKKVIILLGPPGSGKGTQAHHLTASLNVPHISTGDLFRENIRLDTSLGLEAKAYIDAGKLSPDSLVNSMVEKRISQKDCSEGYLLDGYPRTLAQAEVLKRLFDDQVQLFVFNLNISKDLLIKRLTGRMTCSSCGFIHNRFFSPPKNEGTCDSCGGKLIVRTDDHKNIVTKRIEEYLEKTVPLIEYYKNQDILQNIEAAADPILVKNSILQLINN